MKTALALLIMVLVTGFLLTPGSASTRAEIAAAAGEMYWIGWQEPVNVSQSPPTSPQATWPALGLSPDGRFVYLAWSDKRDASQDIYYALSINGGRQWSVVQPVSKTAADSLRPSLIVDGTQPSVVWAEESITGLTHKTYHWSADTGDIVEVPNERQWLASASRLALGPAGELHLVLQGGLGTSPDILYSRRDVGATQWPTATVVFEHTATGSHNPAIALSPDGQTVHLVWQENVSSSESAIYYLRGQRNGDAVDWGLPAPISGDIQRCVRPAISVQAGSRIHVAWGEQTAGYTEQYVRYVQSLDGGQSWGTPVRVLAEPVSANNVAPTDVAPALVVIPRGGVCIAWHGFFPGVIVEAEEIYLTCSYDAGATWQTPVNISQSPTVISIRPVMAVGSDGVLHLAWQELAGDDPVTEYQIFYSHNSPYAVMMPIIRR